MKNRMARIAIRALVCCAALLAGHAGAPAAPVSIPRLTQYATDLTQTLSAGQLATLSSELDAFQKKTSTQVVVLMIPTAGDQAIEELSYRIAQANGIGVKGKNNGILLLIAKNDRHMRIEVGYGLEGALPDILAGQIIRKEIAPRFRTDDYYGGIESGVRAIMLATQDEYKADTPPRKRQGSIVVLLFMVFAVILVTRMFRRVGGSFPGGFGPPFLGGWGGSSSSGGWGGGGGFGGGGFSGGGGSFGGGGASGGW